MTSWEDVPEPSEQLRAMYSEIFTEVAPDGSPKDPRDGRPLDATEHLHTVMVCAEADMPHSELVRVLFGTGFNVRGVPYGMSVDSEVFEAYVRRLETEAGVTLR